jgi:hypothetical protein
MNTDMAMFDPECSIRVDPRKPVADIKPTGRRSA